MEQTVQLKTGAELCLLEPVEEAKGMVLICPGGSYAHISPREGLPVANALKTYGWECAILHYSCYEEEKGEPLGLLPLQQLGEAVGYIRSMRPGMPVVVCGFSAGGHLAASLGVHWKTLSLPKPDALVLCYPVISAGKYAHRLSFSHLAVEKEQAFFSLELHVGGHVPPTFLWHTVADEAVPVQNSLLFAGALAKADVPFELHLFQEGEHGLSLATAEVADERHGIDAHVAQWLLLCAQWLNIQVKE